MRVGDKFLGTDGQVYKVHAMYTGTTQGLLMTVGTNITIPFNSKTKVIYERYGTPWLRNSTEDYKIIIDSQGEAKKLWNKKEQMLNTALKEIIQLTTLTESKN